MKKITNLVFCFILLILIIVCFYIYKSYYIKDTFVGNQNSCSQIPRKNFKTLALYHGGMAGGKYFTDLQWKQYCAAYWSFVRYAGINKAMFNLTDAGAEDSGTGNSKPLLFNPTINNRHLFCGAP